MSSQTTLVYRQDDESVQTLTFEHLRDALFNVFEDLGPKERDSAFIYSGKQAFNITEIVQIFYSTQLG